MAESSISPPTQPEPGESVGGRGWSVIALLVSFAAVFLAVVGIAFGLRAIDESDGGGGGVAATGEVVTFDVELGEMYVEPSVIEVPAGAELVLNVTNVGVMDHDLMLNGEVGTAMLPPGGEETVSLGVMTATAQAWCTVPGHREGGMELDIEVIGGDDSAHAEHAAASTAETSGAQIDFNAEPDIEFMPYDPNLAPAPGGTEHEVTWRMTEKVMEIAPGVTQELWTFEDMVPGPTLRGKVGDIFTITLINEGTMGHSLDFHASKVAPNVEMRTIQPGESLVYQFEAKHAGAFMYHCGTPPTLHHIGNGMYGAIIIDPPELAPVDHEFILVQSEFYTGPEGEPGDLGKMQREEWDAVVFNGYVNQYVHAPIVVDSDERIRIWLVDVGPSENSSFHIVGTIFDTIYKEGSYLLQPDGRQGGSQALDLQPAQGGFVEFTFDVDGMYPFVTHKFANVGKGALGFFEVGDVEDAEMVGH